ncbi:MULTISPECIES: hypothetical protein [Amycolatopsis]|uniref:Uncharacterized protein n=1 Tax=Amycolatopsis echigonensis TaxID=2576905 RepID=A0A2N3WNK0_9PSEU|nr:MULTISPECIES: hypothetical protein [Amycolatopsis]PKV95448.1 hypothetical protein ATK30_6368 [Amycolatopsis niigatensis]
MAAVSAGRGVDGELAADLLLEYLHAQFVERVALPRGLLSLVLTRTSPTSYRLLNTST